MFSYSQISVGNCGNEYATSIDHYGDFYVNLFFDRFIYRPMCTHMCAHRSIVIETCVSDGARWLEGPHFAFIYSLQSSICSKTLFWEILPKNQIYGFKSLKIMNCSLLELGSLYRDFSGAAKLLQMPNSYYEKTFALNRLLFEIITKTE